MKIKPIIVVMLIALLIGLFISLRTINQIKETKLDLNYINEVTKIVESNWDQLHKAKFPKKVYAFSIITIDDERYSQTIREHVKNHEVIMDVFKNNQIVGKIIFDTELNLQQRQVRDSLKLTIIIQYGLLFCLILFFMITIQRSLFRPFSKLENFASNVAAGKLDIPLDMDRKNVFGAFTESFDIMREELKTAKYNEYLANISKKELVASLSHDIKTPVASIKALSELMLAMNKDAETNRQMTKIHQKAEQIDRLITDMFHSTLEELGELKVHATEQLSTIVIDLIKSSDDFGRVSMGLIPDCVLLADPLRLGQVFDNVIRNAYKYANTPIDIVATLTTTHLEIDINDYGNGVDEEELPFLFNKFYRGKKIIEKDGAGLGLFISKYLMEKQLGDILCYNRVDGFTVKILIKLV